MSIERNLRRQIYLGEEAFVEKMQQGSKIQGDALSVPRTQHRPPTPPRSEISSAFPDPNAAIVAAYATGAYKYWTIAEHFGVHLAIMGRVVRKAMQQCVN